MNIKCMIDMLCILIFLTFGEFFSLFFAKQDITGIAMLTTFPNRIYAYISFLLNFITLFFVFFVKNHDLSKLILFFKLQISNITSIQIRLHEIISYDVTILKYTVILFRGNEVS